MSKLTGILIFAFILGLLFGPGVQVFNLSFGASFGYFLAQAAAPLAIPCAIFVVLLFIIISMVREVSNKAGGGVEDYKPGKPH
jgi:uncharacterized membrane protein